MIKRPLLLLILLCAVTASGQPAVRRATNIASLLAYPGFYNTRPIVIAGTVGITDNHLRVSDDAGSIRLIVTGTAPDGFDEVRGEFWDIGRMKPDDPRLSGYDLRATFGMEPGAPWPRAGEVTAIIATAVAPTTPPSTPTVRAIVLSPSRYLDQKVTISGQFGGRNLLGDLPDAPGKSRYDFVLRSTDAAIWVTNMRPKSKDPQGKDFELSLDARIDTGRWLQVRGTLQQARGLLWIDAEAGTLTMVKPPTDTHTDEEPIRVPAGPPPEVVFSAPTQNETDVSMGASVRIQFSRDLDQATLKNHMRVRYVTTQTVERGEPTTPTADFTTQYSPTSRVLELKFTKPLERFRTVTVDLLEGILGTDQQPLKPWTLTFEVGGS